MGLFRALVGVVIETLKIPAAVVADAATLGGRLVDRQESFTISKLEDIKAEADEANAKKET